MRTETAVLPQKYVKILNNNIAGYLQRTLMAPSNYIIQDNERLQFWYISKYGHQK